MRDVITWALLHQRLLRFLPSSLRRPLLPEYTSIEDFVARQARGVLAGSRVLDAGAGNMPYRRFFQHARYEATDFADMFDMNQTGRYAFVCSLDAIPVPDATYDVVLNTQVLEHVPDPQAVIREFHRILAPGGRLLLTAPQGWGLHGIPFHFFNFTCYGLELLFRQAGFAQTEITPRGGVFRYLADRVSMLPHYVLDQYGPFLRRNRLAGNLASLVLLLPPFLFAELLLAILAPLLLVLVDPLDRRRYFTLGYACVCRKAGGSSVAPAS